MLHVGGGPAGPAGAHAAAGVRPTVEDEPCFDFDDDDCESTDPYVDLWLTGGPGQEDCVADIYIDWGDGQDSFIEVQAQDGVQEIGFHYYAAPGVYPVDVTGEIVAGPCGFSGGVSYYRLLTAPTLSAVSPTTGPRTGGTPFTVTGTELDETSEIDFGGVPATGITCDYTSCSGTTPAAGTAGAVDVTATTPGGTSNAVSYTYEATADPGVAVGWSPSSAMVGDTLSGIVTVANAGPDPAEDVTTVISVSGPATVTGVSGGCSASGGVITCFASEIAANVTAGYGFSVQATGTPTITASATVSTITTDPNSGNDTASASASISALPPPPPAAPEVTGVAPGKGSTNGNDAVVVTGNNLGGATAVTFGTNAAVIGTCSATECDVTSPSGSAGMVDVRVTTAGGTSAVNSSDEFTYVAPPTITKVTPNAGPLVGEEVTITGTNLDSVTAFMFGNTPAPNTWACDAGSCAVFAPAGQAGTVDIRAVTPGGTSPVTVNDQYTYMPVPVITSISPRSGPAAGGTVVTVTGQNLATAFGVVFGSDRPGTILSCSATVCTVRSPIGVPGTVDIQIGTPGGPSAVVAADQFTYLPAPTVTSVSPSSGPAAGSTTVTVTGTNLAGASSITFGVGHPGTGVSCTATSCTVVSPPGAVGTVDVQVTTAGGVSAASAADHYTYTQPISFLTAAAAASNSTGETVTVPSTVTSGAVMLLYASVGTTSPLTAPSGWTLIGTASMGSVAFTSAVWWKVATATDAGGTVTVGHGTGVAHGTANLGGVVEGRDGDRRRWDGDGRARYGRRPRYGQPRRLHRCRRHYAGERGEERVLERGRDHDDVADDRADRLGYVDRVVLGVQVVGGHDVDAAGRADPAGAHR
jgi:hypothetical protein